MDFVFENMTPYGNVVWNKSFAFSVRIVKFYKILIKRDQSLNALFNQLLRSGTSIGANISEAQSASSKKDFINKLNISLKEAREVEYWLKVLKDSDSIEEKEFTSLIKDCQELIKLLISIIKTSKGNSQL